MNYKNNLSLILVSTMVSGMFSAAVNATAYKFNTTTGNLAVHAVSSKNVVAVEDSNNITLDLSASEKSSQKFAFYVNENVVNDNAAKAIGSENLTAADASDIQAFVSRADEIVKDVNEACKTPYTAPAGATTANDVKYATVIKRATEWMTEVNDKFADKSNVAELAVAARKVAVAFTTAMNKIDAANNPAVTVLKEDFKAVDLAESAEEAATGDARVQRAIVRNGAGAGTQAIVGITIGENIVGIAGNLKYKVVGVSWNAGRNVSAGNAPLTVADAIELLIPGAGGFQAQASAAAAAAGPVVNNTFIYNRKAIIPGAAQITAGTDVFAAATPQPTEQLQMLANWLKPIFMNRVKSFLTEAEKVSAGARGASWLGAGSAKNLNAAGDYEVTVALKKGGDAVAVRKFTDSKVTLGGAKGAAVTPIIVEFVSKNVAKDTTIDGTLKITSAGATQKVKIEGVVHRNTGGAYLAAQDDDSEAEVIWDTSKGNEDENMPQLFIHVEQQNNEKKSWQRR